MSDWTDGYVADIGYTFGYYQELNPLRARLPLIKAGYIPTENAISCELGFGQGISTNIHAAASNNSWYANDFIPSQALFARNLANASGANAYHSDEAFADFCNRPDLPDFDFIGLHGIWSWINEDNRKIIVEFIRRKLKVGGVLYVSYNTQPGWAAIAPLRDLLFDFRENMCMPNQGVISDIERSLNFADQLLATDPIYLKVNPMISKRVEIMKTLNRNYLAHEYFNRNWEPMPFSKTAAWLASSKLSFACSAEYLDHIDQVNITNIQKNFLNEIPESTFRETVRDFVVNQQFRKDYWIKGGIKSNALEKIEFLRKQKFMLTKNDKLFDFKVKTSMGEIIVQESVYRPLLDLISDYRPYTLGQLEKSLKSTNLTLMQLTNAMLLFGASGAISPVQDEDQIVRAKPQTDKLNNYIIKRARGSDDVAYLASPVTGGGISVDRFQQLFILSIMEGKKLPTEWALSTLNTLLMQGHKIIKDGKTLESEEENLTELNLRALEFQTSLLPILKATKLL